MQSQEEVFEFVRNGHLTYLTGLTIDCVVFGYHNRQLKVLLTKYASLNGWCLPGGYIKHEEPLTKAAARILKERTTLSNIYLQQFYTFGDNTERLKGWGAKIFPREFLEMFGEDNWLLKRITSIGYYALIDFSLAKIKPDILFDEFQWFPVMSLPKMLFEHGEMVEKALTTMRNHIHLQPIGYNLLPEKFTLPEIHELYETILDKKLDRRNFANKLMSLGIVVKMDEKRAIGKHRSPFLYKFDKENYEAALQNGIVLAF